MITLAILLLLGLALTIFTIISVGFVIFGDVIVAVLIIAWIIRCIAKK